MMDVQKPLQKMLMDEDTDTAINFLDSETYNHKIYGPIGKGTKNIK